MRTRIVGILPIIVFASLFAIAHARLASSQLEKPEIDPAMEGSPVACGGVPYKIMLMAGDEGIPLDDVDLVDAIDNRVSQMDDDDAIIDIIREPALEPDGKTVRVDLRLLPDSQKAVASLLSRQAVLWTFRLADLAAIEVTPAPGAVIKDLPLTPIVTNADIDGAFATEVARTPVLRIVLNESGINNVATAIARANEQNPEIVVAIDRTLIKSAFSNMPEAESRSDDIDLYGLSRDQIDEFGIELRAGPLPQPLKASFATRVPEAWCMP
jgi:hypothetical protein